jgi:hypothetical protein
MNSEPNIAVLTVACFFDYQSIGAVLDLPVTMS